MNKKYNKIIIISLVIVVFIILIIISRLNNNKIVKKENDDISIFNLTHNKEAYSSLKIDASDKNEKGYLNEKGLKKVENSLLNITDEGKSDFGLFFSNDISIDNVNNAPLIAFNIKKYLKESFKEEELSNLMDIFPKESINTWKWDKCFSNNCLNKEQLDYHRIVYIISKDEFNNYMHKTYNTTNNYDIFKVNEEETNDIIKGCTTIDSSDKYYTIVYNEGCHDSPFYDIKTQITNFSENDNYLVIYNKMIICSSDPQGGSCEKEMGGYNIDDSNTLVRCVWENDIDYQKCSVQKAFNEYYNELNTYKHTFKKSNGSYYWIKSELVKNN